MNQSSAVVLLLLSLLLHVKGQAPLGPDDASSENIVAAFQPSLAVVIGILSVLFSLTCIILIYAKFCHRGDSTEGNQQNLQALDRSMSDLSGIDKTVIESLPFFRFSSLRGSKEGLECSVCLSKFEDVEILRLLPKCRHAFHINCIDQWLEKHSSCPLCRRKVSAEDPEIFAYSNSLRYLRNPSELRDGDSNLELFVQREEARGGSSRFSIGSSFRKTKKCNKEEELPIRGGDSDVDEHHLHKFNHKIIVSDVVLKNRWSSVSSSDLMFLNSEMLNAMSSNRFSSLDSNNPELETIRVVENDQVMKIKEELEMKRLFENKINNSSPASLSKLPSTSDYKANSNHTSRVLFPAEKRSMSEITVLSRFKDSGTKDRIRESLYAGNNLKEERLRRLWLPIARRTVQWFANREQRYQESQNTRQPLDA